MSYTVKEVQAIITELLQYSCLDEAFDDMGTDLTATGLVRNDRGQRARQKLLEFANDTELQGKVTT